MPAHLFLDDLPTFVPPFRQGNRRLTRNCQWQFHDRISKTTDL